MWNGILISLLYTLTKLAEIECTSYRTVFEQYAHKIAILCVGVKNIYGNMVVNFQLNIIHGNVEVLVKILCACQYFVKLSSDEDWEN